MKTLINYLNYQLFPSSLNQRRYVQMRSDYVTSRGSEINAVSWINSLLRPKYDIEKTTGILGTLDKNDTKYISNRIKQDGYYIFPTMLPQEIVSGLRQFAETNPLHYLVPKKESITYSKDSVKYVEARGLSNRYQILDAADYKNSKDALKIIMDENFLAIANTYLNSRPILDLIVMWWSAGVEGLNIDKDTREILKNRSAQMFHFDLDRLKFLKFFIYLTDVNERTGPHVYVRGSHNRLPPYINRDGRYSDEHISENDSENVIEITGKAGTLIAVDTRGLHKGKELAEGERLIFQLEFTNSMFGKPDVSEITDKFFYSGNPDFFKSYSNFFKK